MSRKAIKEWIAEGKLAVVMFDGKPLVSPATLFEVARREWGTAPQPPEPTPQAVEAARRQHELVLAGLPADKLALLEALHEKMEDGLRLARPERSEMASLERELAAAATRRLRESVKRSHPDAG